jgi:AcrR family transcriptional regulator
VVLDAALEVFSRRGYENATVDAVARVAGCERCDVLGHFPTKARLFAALLDREEHRIVQDLSELEALPHGADSPASAVSGALERVLVSIAVLHDSWRLLFVTDHGSFEDGWRRAVAVRRVLQHRLATVVTGLLGPGAPDSGDAGGRTGEVTHASSTDAEGIANAVAVLLAALVEVSIRPAVQDGARPPVRRVAETVERLLRGVAGPPV